MAYFDGQKLSRSRSQVPLLTWRNIPLGLKHIYRKRRWKNLECTYWQMAMIRRWNDGVAKWRDVKQNLKCMNRLIPPLLKAWNLNRLNILLLTLLLSLMLDAVKQARKILFLCFEGCHYKTELSVRQSVLGYKFCLCYYFFKVWRKFSLTNRKQCYGVLYLKIAFRRITPFLSPNHDLSNSY